jgi:cell migration-inducing and hyaluronan-binding protein
MERKWSNDDYGNGSYQTAVFNDKDGSVSGVPNSYILINDANDAIAIDEACEIKPTWNAAVCKGDVGRMTVGGAGGRGAGAGPGGGRGGAPAAAAPGGRGGAAVAAAPGGGAGAGRGGAGVVVGPRVGFLGAAAPAGPPVVLSRNGKEFPVTGETNVRAGTEIKVTTERPSLSLSVRELDSGSWVIFELPGFTTAASGTAQDSLDALRKANTTSYYKGNGSLWVKLVSTGDILGSGPGNGPSGGASLQASR